MTTTVPIDDPSAPLRVALGIALGVIRGVRPKTAAAPAMTLAAFRARYGSEQGFLDFCELLEIRPKGAAGDDTGRIPFRLNAVQRMRCATRTPRDVCLKARQVTITTVELARDVWYFLTKVGAHVRVVCQSSSDDSMLRTLTDRVEDAFASLRKNAGLELKVGVDLASEARASWSLTDGATLKVLGAGASEKAADKKERGATIQRLHTTEIAFWEYAGATLKGMREAIAGPETGTEIVHESTPNGAAGEDRHATANVAGGPMFYWMCQDAQKGVGAFQFHFFSWMAMPEYRTPLLDGEVVSPETQPDPERAERERQVVARGADPEQLKWYRAKVDDVGQAVVDQEYPSDPETCFLISGRRFFDKTRVEAMIADAGEPLFTIPIRRPGALGTCRIFHLPERGRRYVIGADTSEGTGGDGAGGHVYEVGTGRHMATVSGQLMPEALAKDLTCLGALYGTPRGKGALVAVERNNHGHACLQALASLEHYDNIFYDQDSKAGWYSVEVKRTAALDELERAVRTGEWSSQDRPALGEFRTFVVNKSGKAEADRGSHDDHVIMAMIAWDVLRRARVAPPIAPPRVQTFDPDSVSVF